VLVIDDEPPIRDLFARILALGGFFPVEADTAETALRLIQRGVKPDAILLDLKMPGMGGLGFLIRLRSQPGYAGVPVAVVTGDCLVARPVQQAIQALNAEIHFKPLEVDEILDLTTRLLDAAIQN
jgi:CheY-like chemotaxis protein